MPTDRRASGDDGDHRSSPRECHVGVDENISTERTSIHFSSFLSNGETNDEDFDLQLCATNSVVVYVVNKISIGGEMMNPI